LFVAGADWSTLPAQILVQACELQRNALDNCAAACACQSWRSTVSGSRIQSLQLHACTSTKTEQWGAFLSSRAAINQIKLTSALSSNAQMQQAASSTVRSIPIDCQMLSADGPFAAVIHDYTDQAANLQQLFLDCQSCFMTTTTSSSFQMLPMLTHLAQLKTLYVRARTINYADVIASCLSKCPESLQKLVLQGAMYMCCQSSFATEASVKGDYPEVHLSLEVKQTLAKSLKLLTNVSLIQCTVRCTTPQFFEGLTTLTSLSLHESLICESEQIDFSNMTNLRCLDLSHSGWGYKQNYPLMYFEGWSALKVLRIDGCSLFTSATVFNVPEMHELTMSHMNAGLTNRTRVHLRYAGRTSFPDISAFSSSAWGPLLVSLHIRPAAVRVEASQMVMVITSVLATCPCLQDLLYIADTDCTIEGQAPFKSSHLFDSHQLQEITLEGFCCSLMDLSNLPSLTSVSLSRVDTPRLPCKLVLPGQVQNLSFCGTSLFDSAGTGCQLAHLSCLTQIVLDSSKSDLVIMYRGVPLVGGRLGLPQFPCSLHHLHLKGLASDLNNPSIGRSKSRFRSAYSLMPVAALQPKVFTDVCDWGCLQGCTNLQCLTLPLGVKLTGALQAWVQAARVRIIQYTDDNYVDIFGKPHLLKTA